MESASQVGAGRKEEVDIVNDIVSSSSASFDVFSTILVLLSTFVLFSLARVEPASQVGTRRKKKGRKKLTLSTILRYESSTLILYKELSSLIFHL